MLTERVFEIVAECGAGNPAGEPPTRLSARHFITYAVEIEGDAPLYFSIEAVDE